MNKDIILKEFESFLSNYDLKDSKAQLKKEHTFYVARNCEWIARKLNLSKEETYIAWLLGMLHDIGRFEQLKRYQTFHDRLSCNHAFLSADLLQKNFFTLPNKWKNLIEFCVRWHSAYQIPNCDDQTRLFANILRDADKIDIIRVNVESSFEDIYGLPEAEFYTSQISFEVAQDLMKHQTVYQAHRKTAIDYRLSHIAFVYGLEYKESIHLLMEQGYLDQMLDFKSQIDSVNQQWKEIKEAITKYCIEV